MLQQAEAQEKEEVLRAKFCFVEHTVAVEVSFLHKLLDVRLSYDDVQVLAKQLLYITDSDLVFIPAAS